MSKSLNILLELIEVLDKFLPNVAEGSPYDNAVKVLNDNKDFIHSQSKRFYYIFRGIVKKIAVKIELNFIKKLVKSTLYDDFGVF